MNAIEPNRFVRVYPKGNRHWAVSVVNEINRTSLYMAERTRIDSFEGVYENRADYTVGLVTVHSWSDLESHVLGTFRINLGSPMSLVAWPVPRVPCSTHSLSPAFAEVYSRDIREGVSRRLGETVNVSVSLERRRRRMTVESTGSETFFDDNYAQYYLFMDVSAFALTRHSFARVSGFRPSQETVDLLVRALTRPAGSAAPSSLCGSFSWDPKAWASVEREFCISLRQDKLGEGNFFSAAEIGERKFPHGVDLVPRKKFLGRIDDQALQVSSRCRPVQDGIYVGALLPAVESLRMRIPTIPGGRLDWTGRIYYPDSCLRFKIPVCTKRCRSCRRIIRHCEINAMDWTNLTAHLVVDWDDGSHVRTAEARVDLPRLLSTSHRAQHGVVVTHDIKRALR